MQFESKEENRYIVAIIFLLMGLIAFYFMDHYSGFVVYPRQGFIYGGGGVLPTFGELIGTYYEFAQWIDFFLFLIIFLGLGQFAFGKHFKEGGKSVYVGLGIFLALALVLWEARSGVVLIEIFGPIALIFIFIAMFFILYKYIKGHASGGGLAVLSLLYIIFYVLAFIVGNMQIWYYNSWIYMNIGIDLMPFASLLFVLAIIGSVLGGILVLLKRWGG